DTAVVHHVVQPFVAVNGGADRTDDLAGRVLTVHAGHRLKVRLRVVGRSAIVAVDSNPVHLASAQDLVLPDDRNVVLRLAADNARVASDAGIDVDGHSPLVAVVLVLGVQRDDAGRRLIAFVNQLGITYEFVACDRTYN